MRQALMTGVGCLFLLAATGGCDSGKATIPDKQMELPKGGPKAAGAPAGGGGGEPAKGPAGAAQ